MKNDTSLLQEKKKEVADFLNGIERRVESRKAAVQAQAKPSYRLSVLGAKEKEARNICASALICNLYRNALPVDDVYRCGNGDQLDDKFRQFIKGNHGKNVYEYLCSCAEKGSRPAKVLMESVKDYVSSKFLPFYEDYEKNVTEAEINPKDATTAGELEKISSKLSYDEISKVITDNVKSTIQEEIERTRKEDEEVQKLEEELKQNEEVTTEAAVDDYVNLYMKKKPYEAGLFTSIMINKVNKLKDYMEDEELDDEHIQKQAFMEAVEEYTMWEMLSVMNMETLKRRDIQKLANDYAALRR